MRAREDGAHTALHQSRVSVVDHMSRALNDLQRAIVEFFLKSLALVRGRDDLIRRAGDQLDRAAGAQRIRPSLPGSEAGMLAVSSATDRSWLDGSPLGPNTGQETPPAGRAVKTFWRIAPGAARRAYNGKTV